ncbi:MAG: glycosyltransferase, partial [Candidatus Odinarchaeia archaeon]
IAALKGSKVEGIAKVYTIPYLDYEMWGKVFSSNALFEFLFEIPLILMSLILLLIYRPKLIIGNGFLASIMVGIISRFIGGKTKVICSHHGYIEYYLGKLGKKVLRFFSRFIDHVFVNSDGSYKDVSQVVHKRKITTIHHWADEVFFSTHDRAAYRKKLGLEDKFVVLFVGRIDREKHCDVLIRVIKKLADNPKIFFLFVGAGEFVSYLKKIEKRYKNVRHLGYIKDRNELARLYSSADILWAYADETYLARPAIESLASGTPILLCDVPAILEKRYRNIKISHDLIPKDIGWVIDINNTEEITNLIRRLAHEGISVSIRSKCTSYAKTKHSVKNIFTAIKKIKEILAMKK